MSMLVAHRGFRSLTGENRMIDFETALQICQAVEFDIRLTKDQKVIIFHDDDYSRIGELNQLVNHITFDDINKIPFFAKNQLWKPPLLDEFTDKLAHRYQMINVEIKNEPDRKYTTKELDIIFNAIARLQSKTKAEIIISSFDQQLLDEIENRKSFPYKTGYLFEDNKDFDLDRAHRFDYIHPWTKCALDPKMIPIFQSLNKPLNLWTFKNDKQAQLINEIYGNQVYGYISDTPYLAMFSENEM